MNMRLKAIEITASLTLSTETSTIQPSTKEICSLALAMMPSRRSSSITRKRAIMEARIALSEISR